ncbi:MAG: glycerol-3-phosphate 1-O-acyltransferase PlsY [Verrucomicrobia bacterium]|nr:glycerol-3-phosphate 1-O-acyltransferase PlsY [Verrucomicrobiota bacterium]
MTVPLIFILALIGYILGSIPTGYIVGRLAGTDIRTVGSGNLGATNVTRILGKRFGYPVFVIDFAKGFVAVVISIFLVHRVGSTPTFIDLCAAVGGIFAVVGHSFPIWLGFKGGKGVATSLGILFGINWIAALVMSAIWVLVFKLTRYVSLSSVAAAIALPVAMTGLSFLHQLRSNIPVYLSLAVATIVVARHRANLSRLRCGTEPRFTPK